MLQTKALYNLLRLNAADDPTMSPEPWAIEDLRTVSPKELFSRLEEGHVRMDEAAFLQYAEKCETPEELADLLLNDERWDEFYLVIFELWRRLLTSKQTLSIFCDELDHQISLYDLGQLEDDEPIQDGLANLLEILDENADAGADPEDVFITVSDYCAHDLESFLYDYIADLLDSGNQFYASELIDGFSPYVTEPIWFDFLKARLLSFTDIGEANRMINRLIEGDLSDALLMDILRYLAVSGEHELFAQGVKKMIPLLTTQEDFLEVMEVVADYYRRLDEDTLEQAIQKLMKKRKVSHGKLDPKDPDLKALQEILKE